MRGAVLSSHPPRASSCLTRGHCPLLRACATSQAPHRCATVGNVQSSPAGLLDTAQHDAEAPAYLSPERSLPRSLTLRYNAGPRRDASGLRGWHLHRIALCRVENTSALASSIFATNVVRRCLAHCPRSHCLPVSAEVRTELTADTVACLKGMPSGVLLFGCVRRAVAWLCVALGIAGCLSDATSAQREPSAPARSAACMRCVAHALKGDEIGRTCFDGRSCGWAALSRHPSTGGCALWDDCHSTLLSVSLASACAASQGLAAGHRPAVCPPADDKVSDHCKSLGWGISCILIVHDPSGRACAAS